MNTCWSYILIALLFICFAGCGPSEYVIKPEGDTAIIKAKHKLEPLTDNEFVGELLCIQDSSVFVLLADRGKNKIATILIEDVQSIKIEGYSNRDWAIPVILFEAIPTVLLTIAASSAKADAGAVFLVFSIPTLLTYIVFEASTPSPPGSEQRLTDESVAALKKYARFPQGLAQGQFQELLKCYGQTEISRLK